MKNTNLFTKKILRASALAVSASLFLTSCVVYTGGYSETDGVYYDPNKDTLPVAQSREYAGNRVGETYDFDQQQGIIERNKQNRKDAENRFRNPKYAEKTSDWGNYAGTEINYYNNYYSPYYYSPFSYYSPYSYYFPYSWGSNFNLGWNNWSGWNFGFSYGWGSPWYSGYYNPWRYRYYDPFFYDYPYYYPYYGRTYNRYPRRPSGADRIPAVNSNAYGGTRGSQPNIRPNGNMRTPAYQSNRQEYRQNEYRQPNYSAPRSNTNYGGGNSSGFRTGGGISTGSSSSSGMRTGGMRTR